jgi:mono/diheme cytochrome c family protein
MKSSLLTALLTGLLCSSAASHADELVAANDYLSSVKPLLEKKCYVCHGAGRQRSGLRLDTGDSILRGGESGAVVTRGASAESLLIDVLTGDAGFRMPPENEGTQLTDAEIDIVRKWIDSGAAIPEQEEAQADPKKWWSYQPILRPALPTVAEPAWCDNEIDRFIAAMRQGQKLPHAHEAAPEIWLRRVYLDLIGLPPTRQETQRFVNDNTPAAYERVVDDLLSRPQYGERWGRHWMDVWRYSDWYGSRGINEIRYSQRHIWRWRDWIVGSLNADKGYDQMIREMLAADELSGGDPTLLPATGFLGRNWYKFDRDAWMFETVERTGEAFLGLTFRCCRCHDHKFDPVSQEEYYRFRAFFEPHDVRTDPLSALTETKKDATLGEVLTDGIPLVFDKNVDVKTFRFERGDSRYPDESKPLTPGVPAALGGTLAIASVELPAEAWYPMLRPGVRETIITKADSVVDAARKRVAEAQLNVESAATKMSQSTGPTAAPQQLFHDDFSMANSEAWQILSGTWKYADGKLTQSAVTTFATITTKQPIPGDIRIQLRYRTLQPGTYRSVGLSFDVDAGNSQDVYTSIGENRQTVQAFHRLGGKQVYPPAGIVPAELKVGAETLLDIAVIGPSLTIDLNGEHKLNYAMPEKRRDGKFSLWVHQGAAEFLELTITKLADSPETLAQRKKAAERALRVAQAELAVAVSEKVSVQKRLETDVMAYIQKNATEADRLSVLASVAEQQVELMKTVLAVTKADLSDQEIDDQTAELRSAYEQGENVVKEHKPIGETYPRTSSGRRSALANWIASRENPRTARIAVNQIWMRHFGQPLVSTPENFGLNGRKPSHPQLLDWLAAELMDNQWQMKPLHKKLVLSATYRMSSSRHDVATPTQIPPQATQQVAPQDADPENHFYWRMNPRRMEGEVVRDATLALASKLDLTFGGPELPEQDGETLRRRSMYFRTTPNEKMAMLSIFDLADPNGCYRRKTSVVPHQALAMMNSGLTLDAARTIATEIVATKNGTADEFVWAAFETVLNRPPTIDEVEKCGEFLARHQVLLGQTDDPKFSAGGSATQLPSKDPEQRAKENLVHVLLLHNDFVTIR